LNGFKQVLKILLTSSRYPWWWGVRVCVQRSWSNAGFGLCYWTHIRHFSNYSHAEWNHSGAVLF